MMDEPIYLQFVSETRLDPPPDRGLLSHCPSIELAARAAGPKTLHIWRSNGQVVAKSSQRGERESVEAIRWRADGQFLAVGWSDGVVRLMGLESSKAVHQMPVCQPGAGTKITYIGWTRNHAGGRSHAVSNRISTSTVAWQDIVSRGLNNSEQHAALDLPRDITFLEIESALPKISPLPASGGSGDDMFVFTTRSSLEFLFRPFSPQDSDKVDVMVVGTDDGAVHLSIYDSFVIGTFNYTLPPAFAVQDPLTLHAYASHPEVSTHMLAFRSSKETDINSLYLVPMDLTFIHSSPENLSLLASKTTTLQKLLRYIKQVQMHMIHEWQSTCELPGRFLNNINQTLEESGLYGNMDIGQALYHSVVTGHTFPEVKEWLTDQLAERGHKRWDKAVSSGLLALRGLTHENFLPALDRMGIILSRLLGIARFHEAKEDIGFNSAQISKVMDTVSCLMLVGNKILLLVTDELEQFRCFSSWLRHEIDRLASSTMSDELSEKEATMEHGKVLAYIQRNMRASPLRHYLGNVTAEDLEREWQLADGGGSLLEMLDTRIKKQDPGQTATPSALPQIEFLCKYLDGKADAIFKGIAEAEKRSVRFGQPTKLGLHGAISKADIKISAAQVSDGIQALTYTALRLKEEDSNVYIFRTATAIINGISGTPVTDLACLRLGTGRIIELKFLYDDSLLVLWAPPPTSSSKEQGEQADKPSSFDSRHLRVVRIPHRSDDMGYSHYDPEAAASGGESVTPRTFTDHEMTTTFVNMIISRPTDKTASDKQAAVSISEDSAVSSSSSPQVLHMEVLEASSERGTQPPRLCLLMGDNLADGDGVGNTTTDADFPPVYRVYDLPEDPFSGKRRKGDGGVGRKEEDGGAEQHQDGSQASFTENEMTPLDSEGQSDIPMGF